MNEPIVSPKVYTVVWLVLLALTLATTLIGYLNLGRFSVVVAVGIAVVMASLVAVYFMHALYESPLIRVIIASGVLWFLILITLTMCDYLTRYSVSIPIQQ